MKKDVTNKKKKNASWYIYEKQTYKVKTSFVSHISSPPAFRPSVTLVGLACNDDPTGNLDGAVIDEDSSLEPLAYFASLLPTTTQPFSTSLNLPSTAEFETMLPLRVAIPILHWPGLRSRRQSKWLRLHRTMQLALCLRFLPLRLAVK